MLASIVLLELPDVILHSIFSYVADSPSLIGPSLCHILRPLSKQWQMELDDTNKREGLWELAMHDLQCGDYYLSSSYNSGSINNDNRSRCIEAAAESKLKNNRLTKRSRTNPVTTSPSSLSFRRRSVRLKPTSPKELYIHTYNLLLSRNENALLELTEHAQQSQSSSTKKRLSPSIVKKIIIEYGPIAINRRVQTGGTYLVEIVRARNVHESVILKCCKLVIEKYGANPNVPSAEMMVGNSNSETVLPTSSSQQSLRGAGAKREVSAVGNSTKCQTETTGKELYSLIIASARGMSSVVQYLLTNGANINVKGSSKFRSWANPRKCIKGVELTSLQFARRMYDMEVENGCKLADLHGLLRTISILEKHVV